MQISFHPNLLRYIPDQLRKKRNIEEILNERNRCKAPDALDSLMQKRKFGFQYLKQCCYALKLLGEMHPGSRWK